jgi:cytochrome c oxidase subunit 2
VAIVAVVICVLGLGGIYLRRLYMEYVQQREEFIAAYSGTSTASFTVTAVARKFEWHFHYPGVDGVYGQVSQKDMSTTNPVGLDHTDPQAQDDVITRELVLPCGSGVQIFTRSADVIHALGKLHGSFELDATPGVHNESLLQTPTTPASGTLRCVQLCGAGHKDHHAPYQFVTLPDFEKWLSEQPTVAQTTAKPAPEAPGK